CTVPSSSTRSVTAYPPVHKARPTPRARMSAPQMSRFRTTGFASRLGPAAADVSGRSGLVVVGARKLDGSRVVENDLERRPQPSARGSWIQCRLTTVDTGGAQCRQRQRRRKYHRQWHPAALRLQHETVIPRLPAVIQGELRLPHPQPPHVERLPLRG